MERHEDEDSRILNSNFDLDHVGEVSLTLNSDELSWIKVDSFNKNNDTGSSCLGKQLVSRRSTTIKFSDAYAVEFIDWGVIHEPVLGNAPGRLLGRASEMFRFTVHCFRRSKTQPSLWKTSIYTFGHKDLGTCHLWVTRINFSLNMEVGRPKSLLVFVHPRSGKGNGCRIWDEVAPIFRLAQVRTKVLVTHRAGQALDAMSAISNRVLNSYDGVLAVGGDGFFNEILNGLLLSRHKATYPPSPTEFSHSVNKDDNNLVYLKETHVGTSEQNEGSSHLLSIPETIKSQTKNHRPEDDICNSADQEGNFHFPNERFRFGLIPAGSTDAIVMCTTGARDPTTSALHIVLGKRISLDIAQIVRWKATFTSKEEISVRYAASFAGYGFYGDVITESEKYRWMGPKRYDYAGTKVFLKHSAYEAEVTYVEDIIDDNISAGSRTKPFLGPPKKSERVACRVKCGVCNTKPVQISAEPNLHESKWLRSRGKFLSVGAAVIACRNEKAPDGLVADAHLSDGFLHLILIKDCPRALYLWHLTQLARKGGHPLKFDFVEHHKGFYIQIYWQRECVERGRRALFRPSTFSASIQRPG
ncbi:ceramide kinase isoform X4 [Daucus carota subsp. sativus]|uniref:ceramide kinase isoform X4 n=1 Tax=Daucus carota subsp. sativus TaxID=79200 RepID=UPI003082B30C